MRSRPLNLIQCWAVCAYLGLSGCTVIAPLDDVVEAGRDSRGGVREGANDRDASGDRSRGGSSERESDSDAGDDVSPVADASREGPVDGGRSVNARDGGAGGSSPADAGTPVEREPWDAGSPPRTPDASMPIADGATLASSCDPARPQAPRMPLVPCPAGFACRLDEAGAENDRVTGSCAPAGSVLSRAPCGQDSDCSAGMFCDELQKVCIEFCADESDCEANYLCLPTLSPFMIGNTSHRVQSCVPSTE
jgi:hypothetical protein